MLKVSDNRRFLIHDDGTPFFYLGDTAWELFHRLTLGEAERYLQDRAAKGFTVIQAVALAEIDGLHTPNMCGDLPLIDDDPTQPNDAYFAHIDAVVALAASLGLYIGMLPTWGDKWNKKWGVGPEIFTPANAGAYGLWLGRRYADAPLIWILGGDRPIESDGHRAIIRAMAEGLREGDGGRHLMTFHTWGPHASSEYVHDEPWLDFHTCQSGHKRNRENWRFLEADYARAPTRPCMDAEPGYEDAQDDIMNLDGGYLDDYEVRKALYWALFAGAHGHTYGCWPIWSMWRPGLPPILARRPWYEALNLPGSSQVRHARDLLLSRSFLTRIPDQSLIVSDVGAGTHHARATRDAEGSYALIYIPSGRPVELDLTRLAGEQLAGYWYDPRTGVARSIGVMEKQDRLSFTPPVGGPDWVLVLDDAASGFAPPGGIPR
ncbi:MAG TPA: glycoside hydrolase family 140 protein [Roseiflexaceae bacterium]|nr:glycoside hydrolase family 140 protein [Roseiflexaceae bacterium]